MNTPKMITTLAVMLLALFMTSCSVENICTSGQGGVVDSTLSVPNFTGIDLQMDGNVFLSQGPVASVTVRGQENIIDKLKLDVSNQVWDIDLEGCARNYETLEFYVTIPEIDYLRVSGSGSITADSILTVDDVEVLLTGSGNITLPLNADFVYTKITGSGDIDLQAAVATQMESQITGSGNYTFMGSVPTHLTEIVGSGNVNAFELQTAKTEVVISGAGDAEVSADNELKVTITGSGDVSYRGTPSLDLRVTGSGRVIDAN